MLCPRSSCSIALLFLTVILASSPPLVAEAQSARWSGAKPVLFQRGSTSKATGKASSGGWGMFLPTPLGALIGLGACVDYKSAGDSCGEIDYTPTGASPYTDSDFQAVRDACRLDLITEWDELGRGPTLSEDCQDAILDLLPVETSLATATVGDAVTARENLAKAFHALLFMPAGDSGDVFGSTSEDDYCSSVYSDYFDADRVKAPEETVLTAASYDSGYSQLNLGLVRFLLERTTEFRFDSAGDPSALAHEDGGAIVLHPGFADESSYLYLASVIVHESRHNSTGFTDGSDHVECDHGEFAGEDACDDSMFGSYGAQISYLDAVFKGSLLASLEDGTALLGENDAKTVIFMACTLYQNAINEPVGSLDYTFAEGADCSDLSNDPVGFAESVYGVTPVFR